MIKNIFQYFLYMEYVFCYIKMMRPQKLFLRYLMGVDFMVLLVSNWIKITEPSLQVVMANISYKIFDLERYLILHMYNSIIELEHLYHFYIYMHSHRYIQVLNHLIDLDICRQRRKVF